MLQQIRFKTLKPELPQHYKHCHNVLPHHLLRPYFSLCYQVSSSKRNAEDDGHTRANGHWSFNFPPLWFSVAEENSTFPGRPFV